jgi:hypothetical protein
MIDPTLVTDTRTHSGQNMVATLNGEISIEQGSGRMVIRDPTTQTPIQVHDRSGSHYNDDDGNEMTRVNTLGVNTIDPDTGIWRGRFGIAATDKRPFSGFSKTGKDIRTLLGEGTS